jgi:hypothetical protein
MSDNDNEYWLGKLEQKLAERRHEIRKTHGPVNTTQFLFGYLEALADIASDMGVALESEPQQATLTASMTGSTIASMQPGEATYVFPWAMYADADRKLWLHGDYRTRDRFWGAETMRVERRADGYHVWPVPGRKYMPEALLAKDRVPVVKLESTVEI